MIISFAGEHYTVLDIAYRDGLAAWYKILMLSGLSWVRAEEVVLL